MALVKLLENLVTTKNGKRTISDKYTSKQLVDTVENLAKLSEARIDTAEGLNTYRELTGDKATEYSDEIELRQKTIVTGANMDYSMYIQKHFAKVIEETSETDKMNLALKYCPENEMKDNKTFNDATKTIRESNKELEEIANDPKKYISAALKDTPKIFAHYITLFSDEFLNIREKRAQKNAIAAVRKYDAKDQGKFLRTTKRHIDTQNKIIETKETELNKYIETKIKERTERGAGDFTAKEYAEMTRVKQKALKDTIEKYSDAGMRKLFVQETTIKAIQEIKKQAGEKATSVELSNLVGGTYDISKTAA